jgi:hypothetical protein
MKPKTNNVAQKLQGPMGDSWNMVANKVVPLNAHITTYNLI